MLARCPETEISEHLRIDRKTLYNCRTKDESFPKAYSHLKNYQVDDAAAPLRKTPAQPISTPEQQLKHETPPHARASAPPLLTLAKVPQRLAPAPMPNPNEANLRK